MNEVEKPSVCPTCKSPHLSGAFCPQCGQKLSIQRFTLNRSLSAVLSQVFNLEKGFLYTLKELILRPEWVRDRYLQQGTARYFHPFRFVFVLATLSALLTVLMGAFGVNNGMEPFQSIPDSEQGAQFIRKIVDFTQNYLAFIMLLAIPFYALVAGWFYRKFKLYYGEHLIMASYANGLALALGLPAIALILLPRGPIIFSMLSTLISVLAMAWVYRRCFRQSWILSIVKMVLITLIVGIMSVLLGGTIGFLYAITTKMAR